MKLKLPKRLLVTLSSWMPSRRHRPLLMLGIVGTVIVQGVFLHPATLEQPGVEANGRSLMPRDELLHYFVPSEPPLAPGIPYTQIPNYNLLQFRFLSSKAGVKQWKIVADRAHLYESQNLVHAVGIDAYLFDEEEQATHIVSKEAKYLMKDRQLELYGAVKATFPDGFELESEYLLYNPDTHIITIPRTYPVQGLGDIDPQHDLRFKSHGIHIALKGDEVRLPEAADVIVARHPLPAGAPAQKPDWTRIRSDEAVIHRVGKTAHFGMYLGRPAAERFVKVEQPDLRLQSRTADLNYDDYARQLHYMVARTDVAIKEEGENGEDTRYATCGQADFDSQQNRIVLTQFPQVYQNSDTITGEVITIYRDTDTVEVEQSNAFSEGKEKG